MHSQPRLDWASFQRLDNASVVDFLTAAAGALSEMGELEPKDIDALRVSLAGTQEMAVAQGGPVLVHLDRLQSDFLARLSARYGKTGLCQILWRRSLSKALGDTDQILREWGLHCAKRAETFFNRPLVVWSDTRCERQILYSEALCQFAEFLAATADDLAIIRSSLKLMPPADTVGVDPRDRDIDNAIARATGFFGVEPVPHSPSVENRLMRRIAAIGQDLADVLVELLTQLERNKVRKTIADAKGVADWLQLEIQQAAAITLPKDQSIEACELRRQRLLASINGINQCLVALSELVGSELAAPDEQSTSTMPIPQSVIRTLAQDLMRHAVNPLQAVPAAEALVSYCTKNGIKASEIIPAELSKIHPHLVLSTLDLFKSIDKDRGPIAINEGRKKQLLERLHNLVALFSSASSVGLALCVATTLILGGCGVKKPPRSELADIRPSIPFRVAEPLFDEPSMETTPHEQKH